MPPSRPHPTKAELQILRVLWSNGVSSVRSVQQALSRSKPTGYTSVLKTMQIMTAKALVARDDSVRPQLYRARFTEDRTQRQLLADLLQRAYGGSIKALVMHALGGRRVPADELQAIEQLLDRLDGDGE